MITEAGKDPLVAGLVYVAAHMPDAGENEADDGRRFPSDLGKSGAIKKTADGFTCLDPTQFHEFFAADLSAEQAFSCHDHRYSTPRIISKQSSPRLHGEKNRVGWS